MSRRNMSERANYGLMLCERIERFDSGVQKWPNTSSAEERNAEQLNLNTLNGLVPKGVSDENKFRPLVQVLQNIGKSNTDGITPDTTPLGKNSTKLFLDFIKEAVPPTGNPEADKANVQKVLTEIKGTFGLSDEQIKGLQKTLDKSTREQLSDSFQQREGADPKKNPWEPLGTRSRMDANESQH